MAGWRDLTEGSLCGSGLTKVAALLPQQTPGFTGIVSQRVAAFRALWAAKKGEADKKKKDESSRTGQKGKEREAGPEAGGGGGGGGGELANRLPILLLLPLLRSQSKASPELKEEVAGILFSSLLEARDGQALARQCLRELADLLATWLEESSSPKVAAALVAVSVSQPVCPTSLICCVHLFNRLKLPSLPVARLLQRLANGRNEQSAIESTHVQSEEECSQEALKDGLLLHLGHLATESVTNPSAARVRGEPGHMDRVLDLLQDALEREAQSSVLALLQQLRADLVVASPEGEVRPRLKTVLWSLLDSTDSSISEATSCALLAAVPTIWPSYSEQARLALHLLQQSESLGKSRLLDLLLSEWRLSLNSGKPVWREQILEETVLSFVTAIDRQAIKQMASTGQTNDTTSSEDERISPVANTARASSSKLNYLAALQSRLMATMLLQEDQELDCGTLPTINVWCEMVLQRSREALQEAQELILQKPEGKEEVEQVLRGGFIGELTLPLVTTLSAVEEVEVCRQLIIPLVSLLIQAHGLLEAAKDPAAEDLHESLKTSTSTERCINISLDLALTLACVVSAWFKILHMPPSSGSCKEPDYLVLLERRVEQACMQREEAEEEWKLPLLRPSLQSLLQVDILRQGVQKAVHGLSKPALAEARSQFSVLVRSLQAGAEMESRWEDALDDIRGGVGTPLLAEMSGGAGMHCELRKLCNLLFGKEQKKREGAKEEDLAERLAIHLEKEAREPRGKSCRLPRSQTRVAQILERLELVQNGALAGLAKDPQRLVGETSGNNHLGEDPKEEKDQFSEEKFVEEVKLVSLLFSLLQSSHSSDDLTKLMENRAERGKSRNDAFIQASRLVQTPGLMGIAATAVARGAGLDQLDRAGRDLVATSWGQVLSGLVRQASANSPPAAVRAIVTLSSTPCSSRKSTVVSESGLVDSLQVLCEAKGESGRLGWRGLVGLVQGADHWGSDSRLHCQVADLIVKRMVAAQTRGEEDRMGEILVLLDRVSASPLGQKVLCQPHSFSLLVAASVSASLPPGPQTALTHLLEASLQHLSPPALSSITLPLGFNCGSSVEDGVVNILLSRLAGCLVPGGERFMYDNDKGTGQEGKLRKGRDANLDLEDDPMERDLASMDEAAAESPSQSVDDATITNTAEDTEVAEGAVNIGTGQNEPSRSSLTNDTVDNVGMERRLALFLHKREDESPHEVIQQLLTATMELRLLRLTGSQSMERIVTMDKELGRSNKTEVVMDDATVVLRRAVKLAQGGLLVSIGPSQRQGEDSRAAQVAEKRNVALLSTDPVRPFLSSTVAANLAKEQVKLLQAALNLPCWSLPLRHHIKRILAKLATTARSEGLLRCTDEERLKKVSIDAGECLACVSILSSLLPSLRSLDLQDAVIASLGELAMEETTPMFVPLPSMGNPQGRRLAAGRLVAQLRSASFQLLERWVKEAHFARRFKERWPESVVSLSCLAKEALPSDRPSTVVKATLTLRSLYRDGAQPQPPPSRQQRQKSTAWQLSRSFPPLRSLLLTHNQLGLTFYSDPVGGPGLPRGAFVYASHPLPADTSSYWELDVMSLGEPDPPDDPASPLLSVGLAPPLSRPEVETETWTYPVGSVVFHSNGKVVHYNGPSLLHWRSLRFESGLQPGDCLGIGWEKGIGSYGTVFFTLNGRRMDQALEQVRAGLHPVVHIQRKNSRLKANFGGAPFQYTFVKSHPTCKLSDIQPSLAEADPTLEDAGAGHQRVANQGRVVVQPAATESYQAARPGELYTRQAFSLDALSGPEESSPHLLDDDSDDEEEEDEDEVQEEDVNKMLVKAWESQVFPIIRRRFRNDTERQDGLEQIRGALSLGMPDIARQTVEFLYEDTGGLPRDLAMPGLEEMHEERSKLQLHHLRRGQKVVIEKVAAGVPHLVLAGQQSRVLEVDMASELVMVDTYLASEGRLVRFWHPLSSLSKPEESTGPEDLPDLGSIVLHKELLSWEAAGIRLGARAAYLNFLEHEKEAFNTDDLALLSASLLASPSGANLLDRHLGSHLPSSRVLELAQGRASSIFYQQPTVLENKVDEAIGEAVEEGTLRQMTTKLCSCLVLAPFGFTTEEIEISDNSPLHSSLHFPTAIAVFASLKPGEGVDDTDDLTVQLQVTDHGQTRRSGHFGKVVPVQWPQTASSSALDAKLGPVALATNRLAVSHSGGEEGRWTLVLQGVPPTLPLALLYIERLVLKCKDTRPEDFLHCLSHLCSFLAQFDCPVLLKERILPLVAELVRCSGSIPDDATSVLEALQQEAISLHIWESRGESGFSIYLQALLEVSLAFSETTGVRLPTPWHKQMVLKMRTLRALVEGGARDFLREVWDQAIKTESGAGEWSRLIVVPQGTAEVQDEVCRVLGPLGSVWIAREEGPGFTIAQVRSSAVKERAVLALSNSRLLAGLSGADLPGGSVIQVASGYRTGQVTADQALEYALSSVLLLPSGKELRSECYNALEDIFLSCYMLAIQEVEEEEEDCIALTTTQILQQEDGNQLILFLQGLQGQNPSEQSISELLTRYGDDSNGVAMDTKEGASTPGEGQMGGEQRKMGLSGFLQLVTDTASVEVRRVWAGLHAAGFDLHLERLPKVGSTSSWGLQKDQALMAMVEDIASSLGIPPTDIQPGEITPSQAELGLHEQLLAGFSKEQLRGRFALLASFNRGMEEVLPLLDLRGAEVYPRSCGGLLSKARGLLFSTTKSRMLNISLNSSAQRKPDTAAPEVLMDPLLAAGGGSESWRVAERSLNQLGGLPSSGLAVPVARGADPLYPVTVRMADGEPVEGNSGSFRHLLSTIVSNLDHPSLGLLLQSGGGQHQLHPRGQPRLLHGLGQLIGMGLRGRVPLPLPLVPSLWRGLTGDTGSGQQGQASHEVVDDLFWTFPSATGVDVELIEGGRNVRVKKEEGKAYWKAVSDLKQKEEEAKEQVEEILGGLATLVPLSLVRHLFTPTQLELEVCGDSKVDVAFLQCYTMYQAGLTEEDAHIRNFWDALRSFSQAQLASLIKFACNQDRIPMSSAGASPPPPYPMKLAPADVQQSDDPDSKLIRAETCVFLVKLPRYSSYQIMRERLLQVLTAALDPLSG